MGTPCLALRSRWLVPMKVAATISEVPTLPTATNKKLVCAAQLDYKRPKVTM